MPWGGVFWILESRRGPLGLLCAGSFLHLWMWGLQASGGPWPVLAEPAPEFWKPLPGQSVLCKGLSELRLQDVMGGGGQPPGTVPGMVGRCGPARLWDEPASQWAPHVSLADAEEPAASRHPLVLIYPHLWLDRRVTACGRRPHVCGVPAVCTPGLPALREAGPGLLGLGGLLSGMCPVGPMCRHLHFCFASSSAQELRPGRAGPDPGPPSASAAAQARPALTRLMEEGPARPWLSRPAARPGWTLPCPSEPRLAQI